MTAVEVAGEVREIRTGADLVAFWRAEELIGNVTPGEDSPAQARLVREQAQRRVVVGHGNQG